MIRKQRYLFRRVAIIGVGLIGGSLGLAIKKFHLAREVIGVSRHHSTLVYALKNKVIDRSASDPTKAVKGADLVILAVPVKTMIQLLPEIAKNLRRGTIVTDVGSTKATIVEHAQKILPSHSFFIGSHPVAGSEKKGAMWSNADLFQKSVCIMTPTSKTNKNAQERVQKFWARLGSQVKFLSPDDHDKTLAFISHVPHLLAFGLIEALPPDCIGCVSQSFKDMTRIAASDPHVWSQICLENPKNIIHSLDDLIKILADYRKMIAARDQSGLIEKFKYSKSKRDGII